MPAHTAWQRGLCAIRAASLRRSLARNSHGYHGNEFAIAVGWATEKALDSGRAQMDIENEWVEVDVVVTNPHGLHWRPSFYLATLANRFTSHIRIRTSMTEVDGRSMLEVVKMFAVKGTPLQIRALGSDADEAVAALKHFVEFEAGLYDQP